MNLAVAISRPLYAMERLLASLQPLLALAVRLWVGWQFFKSGLVKVGDWENTLFLFRNEYHTPLLSPEIAAVAGATGELLFPVLLWLGVFGRLSAVGLLAVNVMAVVAYADVLLSSGFEAALAQHYLWGFMLIVLAIYGPGRLSADELFLSRWLDRQP